MADFDTDIKNFSNYGTFIYKLDEAGNVILNPSSSVFQQHFISIPLVDYLYNIQKILSFYNPNFIDFPKLEVTSSASMLPLDVVEQINTITKQNTELQSRLDSLIAQSEVTSTSADQQAIKDIVIGLRIQLQQGNSSLDFQSDFPYLPIPIDKRENP